MANDTQVQRKTGQDVLTEDTSIIDPPTWVLMHYVKPQLIRHGDFRDITLGGSIGMGESGMYTTHAFS